jgi:hypothetical protein
MFTLKGKKRERERVSKTFCFRVDKREAAKKILR